MIWPMLVWGLLGSGLPARPHTYAPAAQTRPNPGAALTLRLPAGAARRNGVRWQRLQRVSRRAARPALGLVLSAEPLVLLRERYTAAQARLRQQQLHLQYAQRERRRLRRLYAQRQNVSLKSLQQAELAVAGDRASVQAGRAGLALIAAETRQEWGPAVARWLAAPGTPFARLLNLKAYLVELTLPPGTRAPRQARLRAPSGGAAITAELVSIYPQVNPRLQAPGYLYLAPARGLAPGLSLSAAVLGPRRRGVRIPASARLYWRGGAWIFLRRAPGVYRLTRLPATAAGGITPAPGLAGQAAVIAGAQQLFSQYQRQNAQAPPAGAD